MKLSLRKRTVIWNTFTLVCNTYTLARDTLRQTQLLQANCSDHGETNYSLWLRLKVWCLYKMWISIYRSYHRHWKPWWIQDLNTAGIQYRWHSVPLTFTAPSTHWKDKGFKKKPAIPNMNNTEQYRTWISSLSQKCLENILVCASTAVLHKVLLSSRLKKHSRKMMETLPKMDN